MRFSGKFMIEISPCSSKHPRVAPFGVSELNENKLKCHSNLRYSRGLGVWSSWFHSANHRQLTQRRCETKKQFTWKVLKGWVVDQAVVKPKMGGEDIHLTSKWWRNIPWNVLFLWYYLWDSTIYVWLKLNIYCMFGQTWYHVHFWSFWLLHFLPWYPLHDYMQCLFCQVLRMEK